MKKSRRIAVGCSIAAAIFFGIASYGHFYRGRMELGWVFAILAIAQLALAVKNRSLIKTNRQEEYDE